LSTTRFTRTRRALAASIVALAAVTRAGSGDAAPQHPSLIVTPDPNGLMGMLKIDGPIDRSGPFFQSLGTNGRSCATCHDPQEAMTFTPAHARQVFADSGGADPLFARVDGANCDNVEDGDRSGHSLILENGLIRIALPVPANAEFSISVVSDPYGCALRIDPKTHVLTVSVYRRPLPATNLSFLSAVMVDGRETVAPLTSEATDAANLRTDLIQQAIDATTGHAQAITPPTPAQLDGIVDFELALYTAQLLDYRAGPLDAHGASGGPASLSAQSYYPGINDSLGQDPHGNGFDPTAMTLYSAWAQASSAPEGDADDSRVSRAAIEAGERLFNSAPLEITNVRGINDNPALGNPVSLKGTCTTCHDAPNVGDHSLPLPLDIGTSHTANPSFEPDPTIAAAVSQLSAAPVPLFLISGCPDPFDPGQMVSFYTTDPGRALITGRCSDLNRIKGPILRGLAARAPYFHNGAAATLREVVNFYDKRFQMGLTEDQKEELVAFLNSL
jgi:cytochrome c peroxidase